METTEKFSGLASVYAAGRPAYADEFLTELYEKFGFSTKSVMADIGSGTGKFVKQMLDRGSYVYCVEPNEDMRNQANIKLGKYKNCSIVAGDAYNTTLQDCSVDFITVAQAFHWFDINLFKRECQRIIRTSGKAFLVWNMRDMNADITQKAIRFIRNTALNLKALAAEYKKMI